MRSTPPKMIERTLSFLLPPACREEVLGDLYELADSPGQYLREAIRVLPIVILSRIRRTADAQVLLMQATALYLSFLGAAWYDGKTFLFQDSGLLRLAIPPVWVLFCLMMDNVYAVPGKRSLMKAIRGPVLGLALAYLSQLAFSAAQLAFSVGSRIFSLPVRVMLWGSAAGLLLSTGLTFLFPPVIDRPIGAAGPALWLKHMAEPFHVAQEVILIAKALLFVLALVFVGGLVGGRWLATALVLLSVMLLIFREWRRR